MDYQKTVNLPQTDFSMKAGLAEKEPKMLKSWEEQGLYQAIRAKSKDKNLFILHDGPPYANGSIHIGHALNKILKDIIVKMKTMQGFDSHYIPGWDCHGLPIEHQLFKDLKKHKSEVDTVEFRKKARDYAMKYAGIQREEFKRLGVFADWENPYLTLDPEYEFWILRSFAELTRRGYVYRGLKPVNWCGNCETALAEAEVEYENHTSPSVYVKFKVNNPEVIVKKRENKYKPVYLLIWTTTPWTLLANAAVAVHPDYEYYLIGNHKEVLIAERTCWTQRLRDKTDGRETSVEIVKGSDLTNLIYEQPFTKETCRVVTVDYVTKEDGTGLVHTAPGHGQEDFQTGLKYSLPVKMPVNERGVFTQEAGEFAGQYVFKANEKIVESLRAQGILFHSENITHSYPHCWRCKKPIIFRATKQWFLKIDHKNLRDKLKKIIEKEVQWFPPAGQERILGMVNTRPDWCLSRQRHWGVPIPALACEGCGGEHKLFSDVIEHFAQIARKEGTDAWFAKDVEDLIPAGFKCPTCNKSDFKKTNDILDVWFDSGVSHQAVVKARMHQPIPIQLYLEGSDQHRGWFQSSIIPAVAIDGNAPFLGVLTHGFVVDGQGRKMSKSLGNVLAPQDVIKNNGADILRLWVAASSYHDDVRVSKEILDRLVDAYRKIRNTARYLLGNLHGYNPARDEVPYAELLEIDQWALQRLAQTLDAIKQNYNDYDFVAVYKAIYSFCNEDLSSFYLDILKDRLYTFPAQSPERRSAQTVLYHILSHLVRVLAPILTFTSEEIFSMMPKAEVLKDVKSVHLLDWLDVPDLWKNFKIAEKYKNLLDIRPHVLKALEEKRRGGEIGSSLEAKLVFKTASDKDFQCLSTFQKELPAAFIVSQAEVRKIADVAQGLSESFSKTQIEIHKAEGEKCGRCWNYRPTVGKDQEHPALCDRCASIVKETTHHA